MQYVSIDDLIEDRSNAHVIQMIDKIWYDWQRRDPSNKNAFGGGSISGQVDPSQVLTYPTGAPPFLNVSGDPSNRRALVLTFDS